MISNSGLCRPGSSHTIENYPYGTPMETLSDPSKVPSNVGVLIVRIGFWGFLIINIVIV